MSWAIRRGWSASKSPLDPCDLVPHGVANHATRVEIGISFPLNPVPLFAHAGDNWCGHGCGHDWIGVGADHQDRTARLGLPQAISGEILFDELIVLPPWS